MALLRLYNDAPAGPIAPPRTSSLTRLYDDEPPRAPVAPPSSKPVPTSHSAELPASYRDAPLYGASNKTDISGKPLLTYRNDNLRMSQLLTDRVYAGTDPTKPQKLDRSILTNGRMPVELSQAIRKELGAKPGDDTELDHTIALELSGSNNRTNLSIIPGRTKPGKAFQLDQLMNKLAHDVVNGKISLIDAHRKAAEAKGIKLGEDMTREDVAAAAPIKTFKTPDAPTSDAPKTGVNADVTATPQFKDNSALNPTAPTPTGNVSLKDTGKFLASIPKGILQGTARSGASVGLQIAGEGSLSPTDQSSPAAKKVHEFLFGDEPILSLSKRIESGTDTAKKIGIPGPLARPSAAIGVLGLTALDFTGWGGEEKAAFKAIAKATKVEDVAKTLSKLKVPEDLIPHLAETLTKTRDAGSVKAILETSLKTSDIAREAKSVNLAHLNIDDEAKAVITKTTNEIQPVLQKLKGSPLTNEEVIQAAQESEILRKATSREATLRSEAALLKTRQNLSALAKDGKVTSDFVDNLRVVSAEATSRGRELQALKIGADPELATTQARMIRKLVELGQKTDDIVKAAEGVDFTDARQATEFYRKFVKPTLPELVDEYRYINLLSSPKTHIVNAFSNILQATVVRPATRLASGVIDNIGSKLLGKEQEFYIRQVPAYYRGTFNSLGDAASNALKALKGETFTLRPDLKDIPTNAKFLKPFQFVPRALEASDQFFRTIVEAGEKEALAQKYIKAGKPLNEAEIATQAAKNAEELVFRKPLDPTNAGGQGKLLSYIDKATSQVYQLRKLPGVKWFVPFVQTPMNILKQGIEYSPLGLSTLPGNAHKTEQLAKAAVGSLVFAGAGALALQDRTTWAVPASAKDRAAFYAAGMQPYAVKLGDHWVSYAKLGPLAYPLAMAAAIRHYSTQDPKAAVDTKLEKVQKILTGTAEFFADQSYVQSIGDLLDVVRGDNTALNRLAANTPSQLIPLESLLRWISQLVDPIYRDADTGLSPQAIIDNLKKGIPGLSKSVKPYLDSHDQPSRRQSPVLNSVSPLPVTTENSGERNVFNERMKAARERAIKNATK